MVGLSRGVDSGRGAEMMERAAPGHYTLATAPESGGRPPTRRSRMGNHVTAIAIGLAMIGAASAPSAWAADPPRDAQAAETTTPAVGAATPASDAGAPAVEAPRPGADTQAVDESTQAVESGARTTGQGLGQTTRGIGQTVVEGTKVAGNAIADTAVTAGRTIGEAGKVVGRGAKTAWEVTRDGAIDLADVVVNFVTRPF
jgi:hypothetical protein